MGEVLHEVDFNQLKIENQQYLEKIDDRNKDLLRLKLMAGNVLQVLNTYKVWYFVDLYFKIFIIRMQLILNVVDWIAPLHPKDNCFISFHFISFHFISFHFISFHFISFHFTSFYFTSLHFISFHFTSFHFISFHFNIIVSFQKKLHTFTVESAQLKQEINQRNELSFKIDAETKMVEKV